MRSEVFAVDDSMRDYLQRAWPLMRKQGRPKGLVDALYTRGELKLEYDASYTRNASQAFAARAGNCLSLVVMTAALAKELGLEVEFHSAYADETWSRSGTLLLRSGHINITIGRRTIDRARGEDPRYWTIDFLPQGELRGLRTERLQEATVVAMFMNNRAAEALARDAFDEAYWWAREGVMADPSFVGVLNTLGVVYQRSGRPADAERVYTELLRRQPNQTQAPAQPGAAAAKPGARRRGEADVAAAAGGVGARAAVPLVRARPAGAAPRRCTDAARDFFAQGSRARRLLQRVPLLARAGAVPTRRPRCRAAQPAKGRNAQRVAQRARPVRRQAGVVEPAPALSRRLTRG